MKKAETIEAVRNHPNVDFDEDRFHHLEDTVGLYYSRALALFLTEQGYSRSGIANILDVKESTAKDYLDDLEEEFDEYVTQSIPRDKDYPELYP